MNMKSFFNKHQLREIQKGLKQGLDVSCYLNPKFDAYQMLIIRYGLELGLDVSCYAKPEIDYDTMDIIYQSLKDQKISEFMSSYNCNRAEAICGINTIERRKRKNNEIL